MGEKDVAWGPSFPLGFNKEKENPKERKKIEE